MSNLIVLMTVGDHLVTIRFMGGSPTFSISSVDQEDEEKREEEPSNDEDTPRKVDASMASATAADDGDSPFQDCHNMGMTNNCTGVHKTSLRRIWKRRN